MIDDFCENGFEEELNQDNEELYVEPTFDYCLGSEFEENIGEVEDNEGIRRHYLMIVMVVNLRTMKWTLFNSFGLQRRTNCFNKL